MSPSCPHCGGDLVIKKAEWSAPRAYPFDESDLQIDRYTNNAGGTERITHKPTGKYVEGSWWRPGATRMDRGASDGKGLIQLHRELLDELAAEVTE